MKVLAVGSPFLDGTGGERRNFMTISRYKDFGVDTYLHFPYSKLVWAVVNKEKKPDILENLRKNLDLVEKNGVIIQSMLRNILDSPSILLKDESVQKLAKKRHPYPHWYFQTIVNDISRLHKEYIDTTKHETKGFDLIYQLGEPPDFGYESRLLSRASGLPLVILIQEYPYKAKSLHYYLSTLFSKYSRVLTSYVTEATSLPFSYGFYHNIIKSKELKGIFVISEACFTDRSIQRNLQKVSKPYVHLNPENAIESITHIKKMEKSDYAIYYARMVPEKGIYELPEISKKLGNKRKILVYGKFPNNSAEKHFKKAISNCKNVQYMGFAERDTLLEVIRKARVVIYPSHADAFSLVMLEALSLGTSIVAYRIPGLLIYENLPSVRLVKEFDYNSMAIETEKYLDMPLKEYMENHERDEVKRFIEEHNSWKKVTQEEINQLMRFTAIKNLPNQSH